MTRIPKTARCPRCGKLTFEKGGLYECRKCGGFEAEYEPKPKPTPPRVANRDEDYVSVKAIDGRPISVDRRLK
jgi:ribosomal protein L37AE/L43A